MFTKSQLLLYYLIKKRGLMEDKTKLAKLQYFSDFIHYAFHNQPISQESIVYTRQKQGPLSRILDIDIEVLKKEGIIIEDQRFHYKVAKDISENLNGEEQKTVDYVMKKYGELSYKELMDISHEQAPYLSATSGSIIEFFTSYNLVDEYSDYGRSS